MGLWDAIKKSAQNVEIKYLGGHPEISGPMIVGLRKEGDDICFCFGAKVHYRIPASEVTSITMDRASKRSAGKAAAGAILGGLLTGGIGLIAGAAIGGRKQDDSIIVLEMNYNGIEVELYFTGHKTPTPNLYPQLATFLK